MFRQLKSMPNLLTLLRLVFIPFIATAIMEGHFRIALALFVLAGITDGLDGLLARKMNQRTMLGEYLDPIADKLLLSTMFLVLATYRYLPWRVTVLVFTRESGILLVSALLYLTTNLRDFSHSVFGKANTVAQIFAILFVLLAEVTDSPLLRELKNAALWAVLGLTI